MAPAAASFRGGVVAAPQPIPAERSANVPGRTVLVISVGVWLAYFVLSTAHSEVFADRPGGLSIAAARAAIAAAAVLMCLAIHGLLRGRGGDRPWRLLGFALVLGAVASALLVPAGMVAFVAFSDYYGQFPDQWMDPALMAWNFVGFLWMMSTWAALYAGAAAAVQVRRREAQLAAARDAAQQAQLQALRSQINPHFLFNALNTLSGLIGLGRIRESDRIVMDLSRLLRHTLTRTPCELVPLEEEAAMVRRYLDIETARFPDRLQVHYDLAAGCEQALVPALALLPLAENSIRYALADSEDGITIRIGARRDGDSLLLWLEDAGGSASPAAGRGLGIGLSNLHQLLEALYGGAARLEAGPTAGGWRNLLRLPWREAA